MSWQCWQQAACVVKLSSGSCCRHSITKVQSSRCWHGSVNEAAPGGEASGRQGAFSRPKQAGRVFKASSSSSSSSNSSSRSSNNNNNTKSSSSSSSDSRYRTPAHQEPGQQHQSTQRCCKCAGRWLPKLHSCKPCLSTSLHMSLYISTHVHDRLASALDCACC
mgnify:CR=1 FL=1